MEQGAMDKEPLTLRADSRDRAACYLYCVAGSNEAVSLGDIGVEGNAVHTLVHKDLCAVVHDCSSQPYQTPDPQLAEAWALAHHHVVNAAWLRWGVVLPLAFNTIIRGDVGSARDNLMLWLDAEYESLEVRLRALAGKAEYAVQIFWDPAIFAKQVADASPDIGQLREEIASRPRGLAYMYLQKLENLLQKEMETMAAQEFRDLYGRLCLHADNVHIEKLKQQEGQHRMLMNLSCLVSTNRFPALDSEMDKIRIREGFSVRVAGPLPPYSFC